jgi:hypothetical protein
LTGCSTLLCEWSDITITAWSSRKSSMPPAAWKTRSSARSASAIDVGWASGPRRCE